MGKYHLGTEPLVLTGSANRPQPRATSTKSTSYPASLTINPPTLSGSTSVTPNWLIFYNWLHLSFKQAAESSFTCNTVLNIIVVSSRVPYRLRNLRSRRMGSDSAPKRQFWTSQSTHSIYCDSAGSMVPCRTLSIMTSTTTW